MPRSPSASTPPCARRRRTRPCARSSPASARLSRSETRRAVPRHRESRPSQVGRDRQGLRRQDRLSQRGGRAAWSERAASLGRRARADLWAGLLFAGLGAVVLWVGADYSLGVPSRIGPGYVPRLLGILMAGLGLFLVVRSRWTTELVDPIDRLAAAGAGARLGRRFRAGVRGDAAWCRRSWSRVAIANYATPENRWTTAIGSAPCSPSSPGRCSSRACRCRCRSGSSERPASQNLVVRLRRRRDAAEPAVLPDRRAARHAGRRAAGPRAGRHHRHAAAGHLHAAAGCRAHHAGRASTTGPSTAAPPRRSWSTSPAKAPPSSPASTGT